MSPEVMSATATMGRYSIQGDTYSAAVNMVGHHHAIVRVEPPFNPTRESLAPLDSQGTRLTYVASEEATLVDIRPRGESQLAPTMVGRAAGDLVMHLDKTQPTITPWWVDAQHRRFDARDVV